MTQLIIIFGALVLIAGLLILINPQIIFGYLRDNLHKPALHFGAVVGRLVLGALLISQASLARFPLLIEVLGWLSIVAALGLAAIGCKKFQRLMAWALSFINPYGRIGGVLAAAFGAFLIYTFV